MEECQARNHVSPAHMPGAQPRGSCTNSFEQFLTGDKDGTPALIAGELRIPRLGTDRLPGVVLVHGSGGVG